MGDPRGQRPLRIGLVAGEASGDQLGAALIEALRARAPDAEFFGVAGPKMRAQGCTTWAESDELAVMGLAEIVRHLPRLLSLRRSLTQRLLAAQPDVFIGIDAPEFNLGLAARLRRHGIVTVQYVSPQIWAWRQGRVRAIGQACDLVLCLLPFETGFYARHGVAAEFVGHPLADQIPLDPDRAAARRQLALDERALVVALLPGSRLGEVQRLGADFADAAAWLRAHRASMVFLAPTASDSARALFASQLAARAPGVAVRFLEGQAQLALAAADAVLVASGTATLETMLSKRPMVVAYRLSPVTAFLLRRLRLVKVTCFSQPNLLAGRALVPEFFQEQVTGEALGRALAAELDDPQRTALLAREFRSLHERLRRGGAGQAAEAVLALLARRDAA
ncbi:MAG: lipid-A-disaccharide synthase [Gammaproteobacteria bacterium]|nr:lipid-A-disaccharide synthase [Gammaproteobacteria bacterium]